MPASHGQTRQAEIPQTDAVELYWYRRGIERRNLGDKLSPLVVGALAGRRPRFSERPGRLIAIGSVLSAARRGDRVWGSGFLHATDRCAAGVRVHAVRGPLTRERLQRLGIDCPPVYGDPAALLPWLLPHGRQQRSKIGILPHHVDASWARRRFTGPRFLVIDILGPIGKTLREINRCRVLLSSSLHGCILGEAYGVPTAWIRISDRVLGNGFKFRDYYAATGREPVCSDWRRRPDLDGAVRRALGAPPPAFEPEALLRSFPYLAANVRSLADLSRDSLRPPTSRIAR